MAFSPHSIRTISRQSAAIPTVLFTWAHTIRFGGKLKRLILSYFIKIAQVFPFTLYLHVAVKSMHIKQIKVISITSEMI